MIIIILKNYQRNILSYLNKLNTNINYNKNITTLIFGSGISHLIPFSMTPEINIPPVD